MCSVTLHATDAVVSPFRFSIEKYEAIVAIGLLDKDDKAELLDGLLLEKKTKTPPQCAGAHRTRRWLDRLEDRFELMVFANRPVIVPPRSVPEPDVSVVDRQPGGYSNVHPHAEQTHLIVEVSDETLRTDRKVKLPIYALSRIPEVWILNLRQRQLERYTDPILLEDGEGAYAKTAIFGSDAVLEHERFGAVEVSQLLPPHIAGS